jgi:hypothetical protein
MNYFVLFALLVVVILLTTTQESFTEMFGFSGHTKPVGPVKLDDPKPDLAKYQMVEVSVDNDTIEDFVLKTNKEVSKRIGIQTYIIETTSIKQYKNEEHDLYECMFMVMKKGGFSFGFSVVASFEVQNGKSKLVSLRSQPIGVDAPSDIAPFVENTEGKEFVDYQLVKEVAIPTKSEFDSVKNKLQ